jgi:hypothetical protein
VSALAASPGLASAGAGGIFVVDDPNALLRTAIAAINGIEQPTTGRGRARMTVKNGLTDYAPTEVVADFVFKNQCWRTDVFIRDASGDLSRLYCDAVSEKAGIRVYGGAATIEQVDAHECSIGYNFAPGVFINVTGYPVTEYLEGTMRRSDVQRSVQLDDKSILHYMTSSAERMPSGKPRAVERIWFDAQQGFRPVYYEGTHNRRDGTWSTETIRLEWARYDGTWYVSRVERDALPNHDIGFTFVVESFTPNADVNDREFTLDGLDIPDGLRIVDSITGITYPYGFAVQSPAELEKALRESQFVKKIINTTPRSSGSGAGPNQASAPGEANQHAQRPAAVSLAHETSPRAAWAPWVGLLGVGVVIAAIGFLACRRKARSEKT